ncbi:DUF6531 domain-containing protein [Paenibacillus sp. FSL L8-0158]|uniref:DUF6531 domain-containing protein n=1 Tax=Paenibacillus sp. FSL L8-0158 TaxID=2954752 RepID=UPI0031584AD8
MNNRLNSIDTPKLINESNKPYVADRNNLQEIVDPQTGSLTLKQTDLTLPGRDGLNLNIARIYQSSKAQMGEAKSAFVTTTDPNSPHYAYRYYYQ